ncbi:hypothetical protein [Pelagicoccus sp. SDUM812003]|uniref:hypothetical protein n=1 Tax=Pelagicoccus sp. SDUM812003 TaxID=3041267 RepID=UPI00280D19AE|nr:hypothetical protein [Pelagicoccus sp. SDUM812003]MDQ8205845.1 hypothetical protein [Pelagicoccus sp. SDUM812003]
MKPTFQLFLAMVLALLAGCTNKVRTETVILENGEEVRVRQILPIVVGDGTRVLMMTYVTDLNIEDVDSVQREADRIWPWYQSIVEKRGYEVGGVQAASIVKEGFMYNETKNYTFIYQKKNNRWEQLDRPVEFEAQPGSPYNSGQSLRD